MRYLLAAVLLVFVGAVPATADAKVDLTMVAGFDRPAYLPTDVVRMFVLVQNTGTTTATGVVIRSTGDLAFAPWGELDESGPGVELAPGEEVELLVTATPKDAGDMTQLVEAVSAEPDANPADNTVTSEAFVTAEKCDLTLTLYRDLDRDGVIDAGEPTGGVNVLVSGGVVHETHEARTDSNGVVRFKGIAGGQYDYYASLPTGWSTGTDPVIRVRPGLNEVLIPATYQDLSKLTATLSLDKPVYLGGEPVRERVTLTNSGTQDITGLYAMCGGKTIGTENHLTSDGWGELTIAGGGPGVVVRAGETRTWEFTDVVPDRAWHYGFVELECEFWIPGVSGSAFAGTSARVPGGQGTVGGTVLWGEQPVSGVKLQLVNRTNGEIVARTVTDGAGAFRFPEVPADRYELRVVGPWHWERPEMVVQVVAGEYTDVPALILVPGQVLRDPDEPVVVRESGQPSVQASPRPALADTGADVTELLALGVLLMVAGALLTRVRRRA